MEPNSESTATFPEEWHMHSFIVKIWLDETFEEAGKALWREQITQVPSGARGYLKDLRDIGIFILPYLESMKIRVGLRWRIWQWLFRSST